MAKSKFWADFKAFIAKGNMIDMAVGIILGGAFGKIISSLVDDILMPPLGMLIGGVDFKELKVVLSMPERLAAAGVEPATINYGLFIQNIIDFLIIALCIFFFVRLYMRHKEKAAQAEAAAQAAAPAPKPDDVVLLEEIRDLLKSQKKESAGK